MCRCYTWITLAVLVAWARPGAAQDFRVETKIFVGDREQPAAKNLTLFQRGLVYDFVLADPQEITVFDPIRRRLVLLNAGRRVKTTITLDQLWEFAEGLRKAAEQGDDAFLAESEFDERSDSESGWIELSSKYLTYRAKGTAPPHPEIVHQYRTFADWSARLNATRPGSLPPFARIRLNKVLAEKGLIPGTVQLTIRPKNRFTGRTIEMHSEHAIVWSLSKSDRKRIAHAAEHMAGFEPISFKQYRGND